MGALGLHRNQPALDILACRRDSATDPRIPGAENLSRHSRPSLAPGRRRVGASAAHASAHGAVGNCAGAPSDFGVAAAVLAALANWLGSRQSPDATLPERSKSGGGPISSDPHGNV